MECSSNFRETNEFRFPFSKKKILKFSNLKKEQIRSGSNTYFLSNVSAHARSLRAISLTTFYLLRLFDEWTLVALDVVGRMKLLTRFVVFDAMPFKLSLLLLPLPAPPPPDPPDVDRVLLDTVFRNAGRCGELIEGGVIEFELVEFFVYDWRDDGPPMLDPLELLRLAGVRARKYEFTLLLPLSVLLDCCCAVADADDGVLCCCINFFRSDALSADDCRTATGAWATMPPEVFNPLILRTVLIDAELFNDDLELRSDVREPLRSTSCLFDDIVPVSMVQRNEFVRFGIMLDRECGIELDSDDVVLDARNDRLRSKLWRFRSISDLTTDFDFACCVGLNADVCDCECSTASLHDDVLSLPSDTKL